MASIRTNWGLATADQAMAAGVDADGAALPATWYIILIDDTYTPNKDHESISEVTGALDPANYSGNGITRNGASWTATVNDSTDTSRVSPAVVPTITASAPLTDIRYFAICNANNITTAKIVAIHEFTETFSLSTSQSANLVGIGLDGA